MFAKAFAIAALTMLAVPAAAKPPAHGGKALAAACKDKDGWADPVPPARIFGDTYYVGTCGITVLLIVSKRWGHTLIDSGPPDAVPLILANIRRLGLRPRDVKLIVGSHEHVDHMGGMAAMKAATGARLWTRAPMKGALESGRTDPADPQAGSIGDLPPVEVDSELTETGPVLLRSRDEGMLNIVSTPGHTSGGTSYYWTECDKTRCLALAYVDSLTAVSRDGYRFADHPSRVAPFRTTFDRVAAMPCDVLITPHPGVSNLFERIAAGAPLIDATACRRLADTSRAKLDERLAKERARVSNGSPPSAPPRLR